MKNDYHLERKNDSVSSRWKTCDLTEIKLVDDARTYNTTSRTDNCNPDQRSSTLQKPIFYVIYCVKKDENDSELIPLTSALSTAEADLELTDYLQTEYALNPIVLENILEDLRRKNIVHDKSIYKSDVSEQDMIDIVSEILATEIDSEPDENEWTFIFPERDFRLKNGRILRNIRCDIKLHFSVTTRIWSTLLFLSMQIDSAFMDRKKTSAASK